jgi:hypothetical protein
MAWSKTLPLGIASEIDAAHSLHTIGAFTPVTDPEARIRANPADATLRPNLAEATV